MTDETEMSYDIKAAGRCCREAATALATVSGADKNRALQAMADAIDGGRDLIGLANHKDLDAARAAGLSAAMVDRLELSESGIDAMIKGIEEIIALPDPVGEIDQLRCRPNGIQVGRMAIPLGVIGIIYESRPNVTVDAAALCLKAGNAVLLRGGSEAIHSNRAVASLLGAALTRAGLPAAAITLVPSAERELVNQMLTMSEELDLIIPRGGEGLIRFVAENSRVPVIKHYKGVCHLYADRAADQEMAIALTIDGKTSRPGVCNALETLLIHAAIAPQLLPPMAAALKERGVELRGCEQTRALVESVKEVSDADYAAEFLSLILAVRVVDDYQQAVDHIHQYASDHTEVIVTDDLPTARRFIRDINSSVVMVNASSRFSDGGQLGLGAEIGISTSRLHAYGPMGVESLTTRKFVVIGEGQVRL